MIPVIGLGNVGDKYYYTRHNVAWRVFDLMVSDSDFEYDKYLNSKKATINVDSEKVLLIKPETFMNNSGEVLSGLKRIDPFCLNKMIVIQDEIDLPLGVIKIAHGRGDGGHNGIRSINNFFGGKEYTRIRIGISKEMKDEETGETKLIKPNILGDFDKDDEEILKTVLPKAVDALKKIITLGTGPAANEINTK